MEALFGPTDPAEEESRKRELQKWFDDRFVKAKKEIELKRRSAEVTRGSPPEVTRKNLVKRSKYPPHNNAQSTLGEPSKPLPPFKMKSSDPTPLTASNLASLKIPKKKGKERIEPDAPKPAARTERPTTNSRSGGGSVTAASRLPQPSWYANTNTGDAKNIHRELQVKLAHTKDLIDACCRDPDLALSVLQNNFKQLRNQLHAFLYLDTASLKRSHWPATVKASGILSEKRGLPRVFHGPLQAQHGVPFPWDLVDDAHEVYNKWARGDFSTELLRGIVTRQSNGRTVHSIDEQYKTPSTYYGEGDLINGQWWPMQLCAVRDGAHGAPQGGIAGVKGKGGATSIVLAGAPQYGDRDEGDEIWYSGTDGADGKATDATQLLVESCTKRRPVRVLRSHGLQSKFRPRHGIRYDGLYQAMDFKIADREQQIHLFHLTRCANQRPLRWQGEEVRPTAQEVAAYGRMKDIS